MDIYKIAKEDPHNYYLLECNSPIHEINSKFEIPCKSCGGSNKIRKHILHLRNDNIFQVSKNKIYEWKNNNPELFKKIFDLCMKMRTEKAQLFHIKNVDKDVLKALESSSLIIQHGSDPNYYRFTKHLILTQVINIGNKS